MRIPAKMANQSMGEELKSRKFWQQVIAEFVGMFFFILVGLMSTTDWKDGGGPQDEDVGLIPSQVQISLGFGLGVASAIHLLCGISGGHLDPAVSITLWFLHRITPLRCILYSAAQCAGAIVAAVFVKAVTPEGINDEVAPTTPGVGVAEWQAFLTEMVLTAGLLLVILATIDSKRTTEGSGPLAIGLWVAVAHLGGVSTVTVNSIIHKGRLGIILGNYRFH